MSITSRVRSIVTVLLITAALNGGAAARAGAMQSKHAAPMPVAATGAGTDRVHI